MRDFGKMAIKNYSYILGFLILLCSCSSPKVNPAKTYTVEISEMQFKPAELTVAKGDTVLFVNKDIVAHDVTEKNKAWASPPLAHGDSWKLIADKSVDYYCSIHLVMKGKIEVK